MKKGQFRKLKFTGLAIISALFSTGVAYGQGSETCSQTVRIAAGDSWTDPPVTLRDNIFPGGPPGGWYVAPIHVSLLPDGKVLMIGWRRREPNVCERASAASFVLDASQLDATVVPLNDDPRFEGDFLYCSGHAPLADGRLLAAGGSRYTPQEEGLEYARLRRFQNPTDPWNRIRDDMVGGARWYPTLTRLADSKMLVTGGFHGYALPANLSLELFDPTIYDLGGFPWTQLISDAQNLWREIAAGLVDYTHVFLLPQPVVVGATRQVAMIGSKGKMHLFNHTDSFADPNERFVVQPNSLRPGPPDVVERGEAASSVVVPNGIMVMGGTGDPNLGQRAHIYNPTVDQWTCMDTGIGRQYPTAVLLPDGTVLVINGEPHTGFAGDQRAPQVIDAQTGVITTGSVWPDQSVRGYHNIALLLPDGRVLSGGGLDVGAGIGCEQPNYRLYSPAYLADPSVRPGITSTPNEMSRGVPYTIVYLNGPINRATLIGLGSMTHSFDMNQRYVELGHQDQVGQVMVTVPADSAKVPAGYYMLFLLRRAQVLGVDLDVPSVAKIVRIVD